MNLHRNARTTPASRAEIVRRVVDQGQSLCVVGKAFGVEPKTVKKWVDRFEAEGKVIAFSGDTEWTNTVIDIGHKADLFICEAYTRDKPISTHMALSSLERHLGQIRPKRLILTHMSNDMLARRAELSFETAEDGMIVEL